MYLFFAGQISVPGVNWFIGMHCFCSQCSLLLAWIFAFGLKDLKTQPEPDCGLNGRCIFKCTCNQTHSITWWHWCCFRILFKNLHLLLCNYFIKSMLDCHYSEPLHSSQIKQAQLGSYSYWDHSCVQYETWLVIHS